jgi:hypothetical protein
LFFSSLLQKADESHIHSAHHQFFNPKKKGERKKAKKKKEKKNGSEKEREEEEEEERETQRERERDLLLQAEKKFSAVAQRQTTFTQFVSKKPSGLCTHTHTHTLLSVQSSSG